MPLPANLDLRKQVYQTTAKGTSRPISEAEATSLATKNLALGLTNPSSGRRYECAVTGVDCTRVRYQSLKDPEFCISPACYLSGRFPSTMFSGDFVRIDDAAFKHSSAASDADGWSNQETLLLLEAIEMYDDDWVAVADHVQTKTKDQCILHFLQLPIEDPYLAAGASDAELGPLKHSIVLGGSDALPFAKADNPVMSVVAFLASTVGPGVAAAAAGRALGELTGDLRKSAHGKSLEKLAGAETASGEEKPEAAEGETTTATATVEGDVLMDDSTTVPAEETVKSEENASATVPAPEGTTSTPATVATSAPTQPALETAASLALGSAAAKASLLASSEERQIQSLVSRLVSAQLKKLELKMTHFEQLEELVEGERRAVELARQQVQRERLRVNEQMEKVQELLEQAEKQLKQGQSVQNLVGMADLERVRQIGGGDGSVAAQVVEAEPAAPVPSANGDGGACESMRFSDRGAGFR